MIKTHWNWKNKTIYSTWLPKTNVEKIKQINQIYGICFTKEGKIMLIKTPSEKWSLPGGTPEQMETPIQTLKRECDEEADIEISNEKYLGAVKNQVYVGKKLEKTRHQLRYFALITKIKKQTKDPAIGKIIKRKLVPANQLNKYLKWGAIGKELEKLARKEYGKT